MLYSENVIYFERLLNMRTPALSQFLSLGQSWSFIQKIGFAIPHCKSWSAKGERHREDNERNIVDEALVQLSRVCNWLQQNAMALEVTYLYFFDACRGNIQINLFRCIVRYLERVPGRKVFNIRGTNSSKRAITNMLISSPHWQIPDTILGHCCCPFWLSASRTSDYCSEYLDENAKGKRDKQHLECTMHYLECLRFQGGSRDR